MSDQSTIKKRRGAPRGNLNALKHGYYSSRFNPKNLSALSHLDPASLHTDMDLIRLLVSRIVEQTVDRPDLSDRIAAMRACCLALGTLTRMVKVEQLNRRNAKYDQLLSAIHLLAADMHLRQPPQP